MFLPPEPKMRACVVLPRWLPHWVVPVCLRQMLLKCRVVVRWRVVFDRIVLPIVAGGEFQDIRGILVGNSIKGDHVVGR
jgi:hypothetical protein